MTANRATTKMHKGTDEKREGELLESKPKTSKTQRKQKKKRKASVDEVPSDDDAPLRKEGNAQDKKRKKDAVNESGGDDDDDVKVESKPEDTMSDKKRKREMRKESKEELLAGVPKKDKDGIAYTKLQIRRMMKRVKRGLPPVPTAQEEHERRQNEARLRREEEAELAGLIHSKNLNVANDESEDDGVDGKQEDSPEEAHLGDTDEFVQVDHSNQDTSQEKPSKKSKRNKPVPHDYVCQACKNSHKPVHWIYDCPNKVTVRGTNQRKKRERGLHDPDSRKLFVSGLPFDVKPKDVCQFFEKGGTQVVSCKLLTFEDTKRCNGQAYLTFATDQAALDALKISGTIIDGSALSNSSQNEKKTKGAEKRKDLKLKVSKVLNRRKTTKKSAD
jgi:hypothetical protein